MRLLPRPLSSLLLVVSTFAFVSRASAVVQPPSSEDGTVAPSWPRVRAENREVQARLSASAAWKGFRARHGDWRAVWNEATGSPHRAVGRGIPLNGFRGDAESVDRAVRAFVHGTPEVFGTGPGLELAGAVRAGDVWYVRYRQTVAGFPVLFSDWEFRVSARGSLFAFGADVERPSPDVAAGPRIPGAVAREAAKHGLRFDPARDKVEGGEQLYVVPIASASGTAAYRLAYAAEVHTAEPRARWIALVDAANGDVLWRRNRVRYDVSGTVSGAVHPSTGPNQALVSRPFAHANVRVGAGTTPSSATGAYSGTGGNPVTVTSALSGPYADVNRQDGVADASFTASVANPSTLNITWGTNAVAAESERDAFYHVNVAHDYVKSIEPSFTGVDYAMPVAVNIADVCNAFWDGTGVNFYAAGGGCPNTASIADVVYHEYGHGVNDYVYLAHGSFGGMGNGALHEGLADVYAAFMRDDPRIGVDFGGPGTILRTIDNTLRWPDNASGDPHVTGLIIGGAFWDLRQAVGLTVAARLAHFAKHGVPDDADDGMAMFEFFTETLVADDDDADLSNGTPHSEAIVAAFNAHGIGTGFSIAIAHTPITDRPLGSGPITVQGDFTFEGPIGQLDPTSPRLHYAINRGAFTSVAMTPQGGSRYAAAIPAPDTSIVQYYLTASDDHAQNASVPRNAPADVYTFIVATPPTTIAYDMEQNAGWLGTATGDNATTGRWVRAVPIGTLNGAIQVQPSEDRTPSPGTNCWVTGNAPGGSPIGQADVDNGRTTLLSPVFDANAGILSHPFVEYYRWYTNDQGGAPGSDVWRVDVSNDGGATWVPVESTTRSDASWRRVVFRIEDYVTPTSSMRLRFIASDEGTGSLVEAAVDDWRLFGYPGALLDVAVETTHSLALQAPAPNPFRGRTTLRFALPAAGEASVRVFDVSGRLVREIATGRFTAGEHAVTWDGRDAAGRLVASGAYFVRLDNAAGTLRRGVVRVQ